MADSEKFENQKTKMPVDFHQVNQRARLAKFLNINTPQLSAGKLLYLKSAIFIENRIALFRSAITREFETGLSFHFSPVFIGIGILVYYTAPNEPFLLALFLTPYVLICLRRFMKFHGGLFYLLGAFLCVSIGMLAAKFETLRNASPIIERQITGEITGIVLHVDQNRRGSPRYLIKPIQMEGVTAANLPGRVRASAASKHEIFLPGTKLSGRVRLQPVTGPAYPGGYDFSFFAWQQGLGGSGFFMGKPEKHSDEQISLSFSERGLIALNQIRHSIEKRVRQVLPGDAGGIAIALITGNRTAIPKAAQENLRKTGLAHILAISGLHMALVSLTLISTIRFLLSRNLHLVQHYPIKKWAVCAGFISATIYLFLSGGAVATQRAWIMISVMLLAIMFDRRGITIRSVVVSAIVILLYSPSSIMAPGFQMSFAAVTSLVAGYEMLNNRRQSKMAAQAVFIPPSRIMRFTSNIFSYFSGIATTSLIAGTATAFIAAWHFHQVAPMGLVANLLAMPIVAIIVMPALLLGMILMPYGLEYTAFIIASHGIEWIVDIAAIIEANSPDGNTGLVSRNMLLLFSAFLSTLTLMKTRLRLLSLMILPIILIEFRNLPPPAIIIAENGRAIGLGRETDGMYFLYPRSSKFTLDIWEKAWGRAEEVYPGLDVSECTREQCIASLSNGDILYIVYNPALIQTACKTADILAAPRLWWVNCKERKPGLILKRHDFEQYGTHAIYLQPNNTETPYKIITALKEPTRPWQRLVTPK